MTYALCGLVIDCELPLPELSHATGPPGCIVRIGAIATRTPSRLVHAWQAPESNEVRLTIARRADGFLVQFAEAARVLIAPDGRSIVLEAANSTPAATVRHLLLDQAFPLALSARGQVVLHASAVSIRGRAVGFLGRTGAGKSTLAAAVAQATDGTVLSDDCLLVAADREAALAVPSYPGLRLWPDTIGACRLDAVRSAPVAGHSDKRRVAEVGRAAVQQPAPLCRLYVLEEGGTDEARVVVGPCRGGDAIVTLLEHAYRLDPTDARRTAEEFARLTALAAACPVQHLRYQRRYDQLAAVVARIVADLA